MSGIHDMEFVIKLCNTNISLKKETDKLNKSIETYETKQQSLTKENEELKNLLKKKEYATTYKKANSETIREKKAKFYQKNKEKINKHKSEKIICECGGSFRKDGKAKHCTTKKHLLWLESNSHQESTQS